jgi:hypothetical protein
MEHGKLETRVADLEDEVFGETRASIFMAMSPSNSPNSRERVQEGYERYSQNYIAQQLEHVPLLDTEWTTLPSVPCEPVAANDRIKCEMFFQIADELCRHYYRQRQSLASRPTGTSTAHLNRQIDRSSIARNGPNGRLEAHQTGSTRVSP